MKTISHENLYTVLCKKKENQVLLNCEGESTSAVLLQIAKVIFAKKGCIMMI